LGYLARGEIDQALRSIRTLIEEGERTGHPGRMLGWFYMAWLYYQLGARGRALEAGLSGRAVAERFGALFGLGTAVLVWQAIRDGELPAAQELAGKLGTPGVKGTLLINDLVTELAACANLAAQGELERAEEYIEMLLQRLEAGNVRYFLPYALHLQAHIFGKQGREAEARAGLLAARAAAESIGNRILLWQILAELGETDAAGEIVRFISEHISDEELREGFGRMAAGDGPATV
jgi:hypothetical protein